MAKQRVRITVSGAFLEGLSRIFDLFSNVGRSRYRSSQCKTVAEQFKGDWEKIGLDMKSALTKFEQQELELHSKETVGR